MAPSTSRTPSSTAGAQTQVLQVQIHNPPPSTAISTTSTAPVLHLRGATREQEIEIAGTSRGTRNGRRIQWAENVVDNEGLGRKKSKVCCIYHRPRGVDESSDESDSSSSDSDSGDDGAARPSRNGRDGCGHGHDHRHGKGKGKGRETSPNAYERVPRRKDGGGIKRKS